jgi:DNA-binding NtrC family response regulator
MQPLGRKSSGPATRAGLVLLYAREFERLPIAQAVGEGTLVIGREPPPGNLCLPLPSVSRTHARVVWGEDKWLLCDLGSRNGTLVNGVSIRERALEAGDVVRIGDTIFKFVAEDVDLYAAYRIDGALAPHASRLAPSLASEFTGGLVMDRLAADLSIVAKTELSILILGETGTGKEVFARAAHAASGRSGAFIAINCAAIPPTLIEGELFGHRRGAFTGADRDRAGHVASAEGGTLFLDEIGDMPLEAQAKLLRMIETREVTPLGSSTARRVDVRLVCATHRHLEERVADGTFRADLFARIAGHRLLLPPLRERKEDIYALTRRFIGPGPEPTFGFYAALFHYPWPFNVRELAATAQRARALAGAQEPGVEQLPDAVRAAIEHYGERADTDAPPTREELSDLLAKHEGNVAAVARVVRRDRALVHRWLKRFGLDPAAFRK